MPINISTANIFILQESLIIHNFISLKNVQFTFTFTFTLHLRFFIVLIVFIGSVIRQKNTNTFSVHRTLFYATLDFQLDTEYSR